MTMLKKATIAAALFAGSTLSSFPILAQDTSSSQKPITPSQTQQEPQSSQGAASAESGAQMKEQTGSTDSSAKADAQIKPQGDQPTGDAASSDKAASGNQAQSDPINKPGSADNKSAKTDRADQNGQATKPADDTAATQNQQPDSRNSEQSQTQGTNPDRQSAEGSGQDGASDTKKSDTAQDNSADRPSNEITGSINISTEQKTEIRNVIVENKVETVQPTFSVSIGVAVPKTVKLHPLPPKVVEIVPQYKSYVYFVLADNRIIIVEPSTYEIVYILVV